MRSAVVSRFTAYQARFEGKLPFMYLDVEGLVTCAIGLEIDGTPYGHADPVGLALRLPWTFGDYPATQQEIRVAWEIVKGHQEMKMRGGLAFGPLTTLRLTDQAINVATLQKAAEMEEELRKFFPGFDDLCADAQLGIFSIAWADGPAFSPGYPRFTAALLAENFAEYTTDAEGKPVLCGGCAFECGISERGNPGVVPRNAASRKLFAAAQVVLDGDLDPDVIHAEVP